MGAAVREATNKLPDDRSIRALEGTYDQKKMFTLRSSGLYVPATEGIMTVKDHDQSIHCGAFKSINATCWWRTGEYAFYPKGFQTRDMPLGDKLVYVENSVWHILMIPDVPVAIVRPDGISETVGLTKAVGMGVFKLEKLGLKEIDERADVVSVTTDFDPATDVKVVDIMRPSGGPLHGWALPDADGYPLRSRPSGIKVSKARKSYLKPENEFEAGSTNYPIGYHGSIDRCVHYYVLNEVRNGIGVATEWRSDSGVAVIRRGQ